MFDQQICCWSYELDWATKKVIGRESQHVICKTTHAAIIYHIWIDRGARIHGEKVKSDIESVKVVMQEVRYKLSPCSNIRTSLQNRMYRNLWNISFSVLWLWCS